MIWFHVLQETVGSIIIAHANVIPHLLKAWVSCMIIVVAAV